LRIRHDQITHDARFLEQAGVRLPVAMEEFFNVADATWTAERLRLQPFPSPVPIVI
jgi:hypothetical protein